MGGEYSLWQGPEPLSSLPSRSHPFTRTLEERHWEACQLLTHSHTVSHIAYGNWCCWHKVRRFKILPLMNEPVQLVEDWESSLHCSRKRSSTPTFDEPGAHGCNTESGHVLIKLSLRNSECYKVPLAWISGKSPYGTLYVWSAEDQFACSGSGFSAGQGVSGDNMLVRLVMEDKQLHSPCPPQVWPRPWTPPGALWTGECRRYWTNVLIWVVFGQWMEMLMCFNYWRGIHVFLK